MIDRGDIGRVVWLNVSDPQGGNPKRRPCLILDIDSNGTVVACVATTSRFDAAALRDDEIPRPSGTPDNPSRLGLDRPTVAKCSWLVIIPSEAAVPQGINLSQPERNEITRRVRQLQNAGRCTIIRLQIPDA